MMFVAIATVISLLPSAQDPKSPETDQMIQESNRCGRYFSEIEAKYHMPKNLLRAISVTESGRWNDTTAQKITWPWTLNVDGRGHHYNSKEEAILAYRHFEQKNATYIDVGCMQVNIRFHPDAFHNLAKAMEPMYNIEYAAQLLEDHYRVTHNWLAAIGRYHSKTPARGKRYAGEVLRTWREINHQMDVSDNTRNLRIPVPKISLRKDANADSNEG